MIIKFLLLSVLVALTMKGWCFSFDLPKQRTISPQLYRKALNIQYMRLNKLYRINGNDYFDFFLLNKESCINESIEEGRSYMETTIIVSNCNFFRTKTFDGNGGVICVISVSFSLDISLSMFFKCSCSGDGGVIYFVSKSSLLKMVCASDCNAIYHNFGFIQTINHNYVEFFSISSCYKDFLGEFSNTLSNGNLKVLKNNCSMNSNDQCSGYGLFNPIDFELSFCTFSNNSVKRKCCLVFLSAIGILNYCNIAHNNSPSYGIISVLNGYVSIGYSIFSKNNNTLFYCESGSIEVSHSFIYHSGLVFGNSSVITKNNNSFTQISTYLYEFLGSKYCTFPQIVQPKDNRFRMINTLLYISLVLVFLFLLLFGLNNRRIARDLLTQNQLEKSLQLDFG